MSYKEPVTEAEIASPDAERVRRQVARILAAGPFVNAERVARFLSYVVDSALDGRTADLKESSIGVAVFDRAPSYDPKSDPIVRVEARRLRGKLDQYYTGEGKEDPVFITVPKGGYAPVFMDRAGDAPAVCTPNTEELAEPVTTGPKRRWARWLLWAACVAAMISASITITVRLRTSAPLTHRFWNSLFVKDRPTLIVPSDSALVILQNLTERPVPLADYASGAYRLDLKSRSGLDEKMLFDLGSRQYTLMPHLLFAVAVARRPEALASKVKVEFARSLQMDDLRNSNVILLGAVQGNPWVELFEKNLNFAIEFDAATRLHTIRNRSPRGSELAAYRNPAEDPQHRAFAVVSLVKNLSGNGNVLIVEGTTSAGNEAAGNFVLDDNRFEHFLQSVSGRAGAIPSFEALLETSNIGNAASQIRIVAYRPYR